MPIYKPSELLLFLNRMGIFPKKGLSQNFLIDGNIIRKIISSSEVEKGDTVLEVGPGPGSLTQALLEKGASVLAVEMDQPLAEALLRLQTPTKQLSVLHLDILKFMSEEHLIHLRSSNKKAKLIANLPYHLTTPILSRFCAQRDYFSSLTVMVQDEVARRMTAQPNTKEYGSLTVYLHFYTEPHYAFKVSQHCFYPEPKVNSAVVVLKLKQPPLEEEEAKVFFTMTRMAFEQRRKMLRVSLKSIHAPEKIEKCLKEIGLNPLSRPENLSLEQFLALHAALIK